jgi:hypothetical protein
MFLSVFFVITKRAGRAVPVPSTSVEPRRENQVQMEVNGEIALKSTARFQAFLVVPDALWGVPAASPLL